MSLATKKLEKEIKLNFCYLPFCKRNYDRGKNDHYNSLQKAYQFLVEVSAPRKKYLVTYLAIGLGVDTPIVEAITWSLSFSQLELRRKELYSELFNIKQNSYRKLEPLPRNDPIISLMGNQSTLITFSQLDLGKLTNPEIAEWFLQVEQSSANHISDYQLDKHLHRLLKGDRTVIRGRAREIHNYILGRLRNIQSNFRSWLEL